MHPLIQQLINKHFSSYDTLPQNFVSFLNELNLTLEGDAPIQTLAASNIDEANVQTVLDALPFGITLIGPDKTIIHANKSALEIMGYVSPTELVGRVCHDSLCPAAENECPIYDLKQVIDRSERILITKDRSRVPILKSATPIMMNGQEVLLEAFIDISERKHLQDEREKELRRRGWLAENITEIIKELAAREQIQELYQQLVNQLAQRFEYTQAHIFMYNPAANNLRLVASAGRSSKPPAAQAAVVPIGRGTVGKAAETTAMLSVSAPHIHYNDYPELISTDIQNEIAIPLINDQELIGILNVQSNQPDQFDQDTKLFLETLATQAALIIKSIEFKNQMRDQLDELSILQRMTTTEGWKTFGSTSTLSASRYIYDQNLQATIPVESDQEVITPDSALVKPLEISGQKIGALGINIDQNQDLTKEEKMLLESVSSEVAEALERARLFETSQRSAAELAVLNEMGNSFSQAQTEDAITEYIYNYTSQLMETPQFYVAFYNPAENEITFPLVYMNNEKITADHPIHDQWLPRPVGAGLTGHIITKQQPILLDDKAEERLQELGLPFRRFGGQTLSWLGVPMIIGNRVLGVISVQSEEIPNLYNQHHLNLLTTIASQAAVAINNTRLFQQEQERAEQERLVRTITDKVRRGSDTATIMRVALEELSTILNADISTIQLGTKDQLLAQKQTVPDPKSSQNGKGQIEN